MKNKFHFRQVSNSTLTPIFSFYSPKITVLGSKEGPEYKNGKQKGLGNFNRHIESYKEPGILLWNELEPFHHFRARPCFYN